MSFDGHNLSIKSGTCDVIWWTDYVPSNLVPVPEICDVIWWQGYLPSNLVPVPEIWYTWHHLPNVVPGTDDVMAGHVQQLDQIQMDRSNPGWTHWTQNGPEPGRGWTDPGRVQHLGTGPNIFICISWSKDSDLSVQNYNITCNPNTVWVKQGGGSNAVSMGISSMRFSPKSQMIFLYYKKKAPPGDEQWSG